MEDIRFDQIVQIFRTHRRIFIRLFASLLSLSFIIFLFMEVHYPIKASVILQDEDTPVNISPVTMLLGNQSQKILNEIEIVKSRELIDSVIKELNLFFDISRRGNLMLNYILNLLMDKPTVEGSLIIRTYPQIMTLTDSVLEVTDTGFSLRTDDIISNCHFNEACPHADGTVLVERLGDISPGTVYDISYRDMVETREYYFDNIEAAPIGDNKESNTFLILLDSPDPFLAAQIVAAIIDRYMGLKISWKKSDADEQQKYIARIIGDIKNELDQKSLALAAYQKENRTVLPDLQFVEIMKRDVEIEKDIAILQLKEQVITKFIASLQMEEIYPIPAPPIIDDLAVQNALQVHNTLVAQEKTLSTTMSDNHPDLIKLRENIRKAKEDIVALLGKAKETYQNGAAILRQQSATTSAIINNLPTNLRNIATLQRDVEITEKLYAFLMQKYYEAGITANIETAPARILDRPTHLMKKSRPQTTVHLVFSLLAAFLFSFFFVFIWEFFRSRISSPEETLQILPASLTTLSRSPEGKRSPEEHIKRIYSSLQFVSYERPLLVAMVALCDYQDARRLAEQLTAYGRQQGNRMLLVTMDDSGDAQSADPITVFAAEDHITTDPYEKHGILTLDILHSPLRDMLSSSLFARFIDRMFEHHTTVLLLLPRMAVKELLPENFTAFSHMIVITEQDRTMISDLEEIRAKASAEMSRKLHLVFWQ